MVCPKCGAPGLVHKGFGTKLLESELNKLFPKAKVKRFDADNKKGEGMDALYSTVRRGEVDILVGTQAIAKGLDLPRLATVGVVQADAGLALPDYLAEERTFQLLTQVIGRVGRGHLDTAEVYIQRDFVHLFAKAFLQIIAVAVITLVVVGIFNYVKGGIGRINEIRACHILAHEIVIKELAVKGNAGVETIKRLSTRTETRAVVRSSIIYEIAFSLAGITLYYRQVHRG